MQLPFAPKPIATELVSSWLLRVAAANFVSLCELLRGLQSRYDRIPPYWPIDYCLSDVAMTSLSKFCRVPSQEIRRLDLGCRAPHLHPGLLLHFPNGSSIDPRCASQRVRYSFCPLCIQTQPIFVRWDWSLAYLIRCGIHGTALRDGCRSCGDLDPLVFSAPHLAPNYCCRTCGRDLTAGMEESESIPIKKEILVVEDAYRNALVGVGPNPVLLGKTTDRAFRQFVEDMLQLLSRRLNPNWRKGPAQFCRQDFVHIVIVLILNAAPCSDRTVRRKRYRSGLVLWTTLLSIIPQYEASDIECASLRWPLALRRRFFTALYQRRRERWPFSPYSTSNELQKPIERMKIASVYDLSVRMPMFQDLEDDCN